MNTLKSCAAAALKAMLALSATCLVASAAMADSISVSASGDDRASARTEVQIGDIDLGTGAGRAALNQRLRVAVSDVCDQRNVSYTDTPVMAHECYQGAMRAANEQVSERLALRNAAAVTTVR